MTNMESARSDEAAPPPSGLDILVVEDDGDCAASMALLLGLFGHKVQVASDGPAALAQAQLQRPDVVLLDLGLPRMNGFEVARRLRALAHTPPPLVVVISGYGQEADRHQALGAGIDQYLIKPVAPDELERLLRGYQAQRAV